MPMVWRDTTKTGLEIKLYRLITVKWLKLWVSDIKDHIWRPLISSGRGSCWAISAWWMSLIGVAIGLWLEPLPLLLWVNFWTSIVVCESSNIFCVLLTIGQGLGWPWVLTCNGVICNLQLARLGPTVCEAKMSSAAESGLWSDSRFWMRTWKQRLIKKLILLPMGLFFLKVIHINKEHDVQWVCNQFALIWLDWHSALELCALCCQFIYNPYLFEGGLTHVQGWVGSSVVHENLQPAR